jgi:DNA-binding transcriptional MerR regulator
MHFEKTLLIPPIGLFGVHPRTIRKWIEAGIIPTSRVRGRKVIRTEDARKVIRGG